MQSQTLKNIISLANQFVLLLNIFERWAFLLRFCETGSKAEIQKNDPCRKLEMEVGPLLSSSSHLEPKLFDNCEQKFEK